MSFELPQTCTPTGMRASNQVINPADKKGGISRGRSVLYCVSLVSIQL